MRVPITRSNTRCTLQARALNGDTDTIHQELLMKLQKGSPLLNNFLMRQLSPDPKQRMDAAKALRHPWLRQTALEIRHGLSSEEAEAAVARQYNIRATYVPACVAPVKRTICKMVKAVGQKAKACNKVRPPSLP